MAERLPKTSTPPSWLKLASYEAARELNASGWYEQLLLRRNLLSDVRSTNWDPRRPDGFNKHSREIRHVLDILHAAPLSDASSNEVLNSYLYGFGKHARAPSHPRVSSGVRLATVEELYRAEALCLDEAERADARKYFDWLFDGKKTASNLKYQKWLDRPVDDVTDHIGDEILVRVNMAMPDSVLKEQFGITLKSLRSTDNEEGVSFKTHIRKPEYLRWISYRILPYIDLRIWEHEIGKRLSNPDKKKLLFSDMDRTSEDVRKTVDNLCKEVLSWRNLLTLSGLAAQEQAKDSSAKMRKNL